MTAPAPNRPARPSSLLSSWSDHLARRSLPHFNQLVIWLLLATSAVLACWVYPIHAGPRQGPATLLFWLPDAVLDSPWMFTLFRVLLIAGILLWVANRWLPWSCWLTTLGFTGLWSMHVENTHNTAHIYHVANMLLVIQSIWITADVGLIRQTLAERRYWKTPLVPRWVSLTAIAYLGIFHTAAGLSKLTFSGPGWASGTSLQLWTYLFGYEWSPATWLIVQSRTFTRILQIGTLVLETSGILAIIPRLRTLIGLGLLGFYLGVLVTFPYGFQYNAIFTALYFLPCERWINARALQFTSRDQTGPGMDAASRGSVPSRRTGTKFGPG